MTRGRARVVVALIAVLGLANRLPAAQSQQRPLGADELVSRWHDAVRFHTPGQNDDSLKWLGSLGPDEWRLLNAGLKKYFEGLKAQRSVSNADITHAALFHADAAMFGPPAPASQLALGWFANAPAPLLKTLDGETVGTIEANWNWIFARALVDLMYPSPRKEPIVPVWYHATAAYMLQHGLYGEVGAHLDRALELFPDDEWLLFDRACLAEILALPRSQLVMDDARAQQNGPANRPSQLFVPGQLSVNRSVAYPTAAEGNSLAERMFRKALDIDPNLIEARVRLARLLEVRGRFAEAQTQLDRAIASRISDPAVWFYAQLFAARASLATGRPTSAMAHVRQALVLYPDAQSALLVRSQIALQQSDVRGALQPIQQLGLQSPIPQDRSDPWWLYDMGTGRLANGLLADLWARARK